MRWFLVIMLIPVLTVAGCSQVSARQELSTGTATSARVQKADFADAQSIKDLLYRQYQQWKGTTYQYGGLSKKGVDCSGFVYLTFLEKLGMTIPRSTALLAELGKEIGKTDLLPGDLVFFKTGVKVRHVGIYIENGKFLHASTSRGVIISNLDDSYWHDAYWHSRRVVF